MQSYRAVNSKEERGYCTTNIPTQPFLQAERKESVKTVSAWIIPHPVKILEFASLYSSYYGIARHRMCNAV